MSKVYYIASVKCEEIIRTKTIDHIMTKDNTVVWLSVNDGYDTLTLTKEWANKFSYSDIESLKRNYMDWSEHPWYHKIKPNTLEIYKVEIFDPIETKIYEE
jgi:hypothetical protein